MDNQVFGSFQDVDLEKSVLSGISRNNANARQYGSKLSVNDFCNDKCQLYFLAISNLVDSGKDVGRVSILGSLKGKDITRADIWGIANHVSSDAHLPTHIEQLKSLSRRRDVVELCQNVAGGVIDNSIDDLQAIGQLTKGTEDLLRNSFSKTRSKLDIANDIKNDIKRIQSGEKSLYGLFGIKEVDRLVQLDPDDGDFGIIAGSSNVGKSWLLNTIACHFSDAYDWNTRVFSMEMSDKMVARRMYSLYGGIDASDIRAGKVDLESDVFKTAESRFLKSKVEINDRGGISATELKSLIQQDYYDNDCKAFIIDHAMLVNYGNAYGKSDESKFAELAIQLKALAKNLKVVIVMLSQLTKAADDQPMGKPARKFIRGSGQVYEACDFCILPWRPEVYDVEEVEGESAKGMMILIVEKNRNGGNVGEKPKVKFDPSKGGIFPFDTQWNMPPNFKKIDDQPF